MKTTAIIWRESVYKNNFVCSCGYEFMKDGELAETMLYDTAQKMLVCPRCKKRVAMIVDDYETDDENIVEGRADNLRGHWNG